MPTLSRYVLCAAQVTESRVDIPVRGPIWLIGSNDDLAKQLRRRGFHVECRDFQSSTESELPRELGGLFFVPNGLEPDLPFHAYRWLRAVHRPLQQGRGLLRLILKSGLPSSYAIGGMVKTARHEWPEVSCRIIDVSQTAMMSDDARLVDELLREGPNETLLQGGRTFARQLTAASHSESVERLEFSPGELIIVTGGARGVTAEAAMALARTYQPTLLLLGRSELPADEPKWLQSLQGEASIKRKLIDRAPAKPTPKQIDVEYRRIIGDREIRANLQRMREARAVCLYRSVDVRDQDAMDRVISETREKYGPVRGFVHGSGVLADKRIADKTDDQFRSVYDTKVDGLESLLAATHEDPLRFIALFSSSTGRFGRVGQCDYAAANEYLNATACRLQRERPDCRTVAINWGPWDGGMVTPGLRSVFASEGVGLIPPADGGQFLVAELSVADAPAEVVVLGPPPSQPAEFALTLANVPPLADHVLDGKMVLPMALAIEYMAESAARRYPDHRFCGCDNIRVLHPVHAPTTLQVFCGAASMKDGENRSIPVRIEANGRICYRADVLLESLPRIDRYVAVEPFRSVADCYRGELFHGRAWQGISAIASCDNAGISIVAQTAPLATNWIFDGSIRHWHADPLMVDCVLQAVIVYAQRQHGLPSLPMAIGRLRLNGPIKAGIVNVAIKSTSVKLPSLRTSAVVTAASGNVIATIEDCEYICTESLRNAFANNQLPLEAHE